MPVPAPSQDARYPIIAGKSSGNKVRTLPKHIGVLKNLASLAKTDYWASIAINHITSLSSGHFKPNVYIKEGQTSSGLSSFIMRLPGCKIAVVKLGNGDYLIHDLRVDEGYLNKQLSEDRPGLYSVDTSSSKLDPTFVPSGTVEKQTHRVVCISDRALSAEEAAKAGAPHVSKAPIGGSKYINTSGFDLHFTPGDSSIGGLTSIKQALAPTNSSSLNESAVLLANSIKGAKDVKAVSWISERGGCGVLTQALQILKNQNTNFGQTDHYMYFSHPTTSVVQAQKLALELGFKFDRAPYKINALRPSELIGGLGVFGGYAAAWQRYGLDSNHTKLRLAADVVGQTLQLNSSRKTLGITGSAVTAAIGIGSGGSAPAVFAFAAAVGSAVGLAATLTEAYLPRIHNKISGKL